MNDLLSIDQFLDQFVKHVINGEAAVFAGAGLSRAAGFVDWKGLLREFATELKLDIDIETDLPAVAQYHLNQEGHVRSRLNLKLAEELAREAEPTAVHAALASLNFPVIWTSNYDDLIERALKVTGKKVTVRDPRRLGKGPTGGADAELVKLHGDIRDPDHVVITKEDYERYARDNEPLLLRLKNDLMTRSFLFLGFSFTDPNLEIALSQVRQLSGSSPPVHYAVFKRPQRDDYAKLARYRYELSKWHLQLQDLKRYGVQPVQVQTYADIPTLLEQLQIRVQRRRLFVSGSFEGECKDWSRDRLNEFCYELGRRIISEERDLSSGFGLGVGSPVIAGAVEELFRERAQVIERRLVLRPFPQTQPRRTTRAEFVDRYRRDLVASAGFVIVVGGCKIRNGSLVLADGVRREAEIARELCKPVLPIGASGYVAQELWDTMRSDLTSYFPPRIPRRTFGVLGNHDASNTVILDALFSLIKWLSER
jgi:hypothetical protein